ncbi:MAG: hypothetical protein ACRYGG_05490 [Janthinobacterium lividum]
MGNSFGMAPGQGKFRAIDAKGKCCMAVPDLNTFGTAAPARAPERGTPRTDKCARKAQYRLRHAAGNCLRNRARAPLRLKKKPAAWMAAGSVGNASQLPGVSSSTGC